MSNRSKIADEATDLVGTARDAAEAAYEAAKRVYERADEKMDDLSQFGKDRPLLAMGIAFAAGYFLSKFFRR
jgi:ElaB/YqjD/DUF883 family membrane-anchored ribosome-binding protein